MAVYMCTDKTFGRPCAVCDAIHAGQKASSDDVTSELLREAGSAGRVLLNALHVDGPTPGEVQILELAPSAFAALVNIAVEWEEAGESIFDLDKGKDILITRTGAGKLTKYTAQVAAKTTPLPAGAMSKLNNLDEYVAQESSEQQLRALNSVRSVSGVLAGPSTSTAVGTFVAAATIAEDDPYAAATPPKKVVVEATDVAVKPAAPVKASPVAAASAVAAAVDTGDAELDEMLKSLG